MLGLLFGDALNTFVTACLGVTAWVASRVAGSVAIQESVTEARTIRQMQSQLDKGFHGAMLGTVIYVVNS